MSARPSPLIPRDRVHTQHDNSAFSESRPETDHCYLLQRFLAIRIYTELDRARGRGEGEAGGGGGGGGEKRREGGGREGDRETWREGVRKMGKGEGGRRN